MKSASAATKAVLYDTNSTRVVVADLVAFYFPTPAYFTNASADLTVDGVVYKSAHLSGIELLQGMGAEVEALEFSMGIAGQVVNGQGFLGAALAGVFDGIRVTVKRALSTTGAFSPLLGSDLLPIFDGTCSEIIPTSRAQITFRIKSVLSGGDIPVSNRVTTAQCPYVLGGLGCGVNLSTFTHARAVAAGSTASAIVLSTASTFATAGSVLTLTSGTYSGQSRVVASVGTEVQLDAPFTGVPAVGDTLTITRVCDKTQAACKDVFSNLINFGGFPYAPIDQR